MNSLFTNEKLGMPVEELRLREIRQQIDSQRIAQHVQNMIRQSQQANFAREVKTSRVSSKITTPLRAFLVAIINLVTR